MTQKRKLGWGGGIALLYGSFVVFILAIVGFAAFQSFPLVEEDYYSKELKYGDRIEKISRTAATPGIFDLHYESGAKDLTLDFSGKPSNGKIDGTILFYRPSNPNLDFSVIIDPDSTAKQKIDLTDKANGLWKIKVEWNVDSLGYYYEDILILE